MPGNFHGDVLRDARPNHLSDSTSAQIVNQSPGKPRSRARVFPCRPEFFDLASVRVAENKRGKLARFAPRRAPPFDQVNEFLSRDYDAARVTVLGVASIKADQIALDVLPRNRSH